MYPNRSAVTSKHWQTKWMTLIIVLQCNVLLGTRWLEQVWSTEAPLHNPQHQTDCCQTPQDTLRGLLSMPWCVRAVLEVRGGHLHNTRQVVLMLWLWDTHTHAHLRLYSYINIYNSNHMVLCCTSCGPSECWLCVISEIKTGLQDGGTMSESLEKKLMELSAKWEVLKKEKVLRDESALTSLWV